MLLYSSVKFTDRHCSPYSSPEPESWVERAGELFFMSVDEGRLAVSDAVKGQDPRVLVQIDADPSGLRGTKHFLLVVMPKGEAIPRPVQAPGQGVMAQTAFVIGTFTFH